MDVTAQVAGTLMRTDDQLQRVPAVEVLRQN